MPLPDDRSPERSQPLAYPEAVHLTEPIEQEFKGEVYYLSYLPIFINLLNYILCHCRICIFKHLH